MSSPQNASPDHSFQDRINRVAEQQTPSQAETAQIDPMGDVRKRILVPGILLGLAVVGLLGFAYLMPKAEEAVAETAEPEEKKLPRVIRLN